jgi:hypothetical protein
MSFPIKVCAICSEEFELRPDKPGYANHCPDCSTQEPTQPTTKSRKHADELRNEGEVNAARRKAIRDLLYRRED